MGGHRRQVGLHHRRPQGSGCLEGLLRRGGPRLRRGLPVPPAPRLPDHLGAGLPLGLPRHRGRPGAHLRRRLPGHPCSGSPGGGGGPHRRRHQQRQPGVERASPEEGPRPLHRCPLHPPLHRHAVGEAGPGGQGARAQGDDPHLHRPGDGHLRHRAGPRHRRRSQEGALPGADADAHLLDHAWRGVAREHRFLRGGLPQRAGLRFLPQSEPEDPVRHQLGKPQADGRRLRRPDHAPGGAPAGDADRVAGQDRAGLRLRARDGSPPKPPEIGGVSRRRGSPPKPPEIEGGSRRRGSPPKPPEIGGCRGWAPQPPEIGGWRRGPPPPPPIGGGGRGGGGGPPPPPLRGGGGGRNPP